MYRNKEWETLKSPFTPSVLYVLVAVSIIPLYCRTEPSSPCNCKRTLITSIGLKSVEEKKKSQWDSTKIEVCTLCNCPVSFHLFIYFPFLIFQWNEIDFKLKIYILNGWNTHHVAISATQDAIPPKANPCHFFSVDKPLAAILNSVDGQCNASSQWNEKKNHNGLQKFVQFWPTKNNHLFQMIKTRILQGCKKKKKKEVSYKTKI